MKKSNIRILLMVMLYCIGLREAVTGVLQLLGLAESLNASYSVTGSFYNPGPYACCLALVFQLLCVMQIYQTISFKN